MWAYEGIFYQIYPIGFCGAPTANDGKTVSNQTIMVMIPGIIKKSTAVSEPMKISQKYAKISMHTM